MHVRIRFETSGDAMPLLGGTGDLTNQLLHLQRELESSIELLDKSYNRLVHLTEIPKSRFYTEDNDDDEVIAALFDSIDIDGNGSISLKELSIALMTFEGNESMVQLLQGFMHDACEEKQISRDEFRKAVGQMPRVRGERVQWARSIGMDGALASLLDKGDVFDGLKGLKAIPDNELEAYVNRVCKQLMVTLPSLLLSALKDLRTPQAGAQSTVRDHINTKFSQDGAFVGRFATMDDFYKGSEAHIGAPNPKIWQGMEVEHCHRKNAETVFITSNYNITTCSALEWEFVACPKDESNYPHTPFDKTKWKQDTFDKTKWKQVNVWRGNHGREVLKIEHFMHKEEVKRAALIKEEVAALRLYTGPMFVLYNAALRRSPKEDVAKITVENGQLNLYETTIFAIVSGVTKLSKVTKIPEGRRLYRGLGGMVLPRQFWESYAECQVTFRVKVTGNSAQKIQNRLSEKRKRTDEQKRGKPNLYDLSNEFLDLSLPSEFGDVAIKGVRVVNEPRLSGNAVQMGVALPVSKIYFLKELRSMFLNVLRAFCLGHLVEICDDDVADKPFDFCGGGTYFDLAMCKFERLFFFDFAVEYGLMSTTASKETAFAYSGKNEQRCTVFEISAGRVDVGASLSAISQYPGEDEYLMPPLACLEVNSVYLHINILALN